MPSIKIFFLLCLGLSFLSKDLNSQQSTNTNRALDTKQQCIVTISAFTAKGDLVQLQKALNEGLDARLTINEIKEVLVHLYAYAGFPRSLNAISTLQSVVHERKQKGINDAPGKEPSKVVNTKSKFEVGKDVQTKLTGSTATGAPQRFVPIIDTFLKEHLFADIFSRDILDWKTREIATISALASLGGTEAQLRGHLNVGLNTGLTEAQLKSIVSVLQTKVGNKEGNTANEVLQSILNKTGNTSQTKSSDRVGKEDSNKVTANTIFPKGTRISNNNFTGPAWVEMLVNNDTTFNTSVGNVTFEPGVRTRWHYHPGGQILLVTRGIGRYQEKGKPVRELREGDVIKCEPNVVHWHGAAPHSELSHVAIGTNPGKAPVVWLEHVTDKEYNNLKR
jgi:quercetin dioxygenase-like cupin family protein/alkylhydroperoxidase/carboxymuconolactone decarboxylase family protein YurZ